CCHQSYRQLADLMAATGGLKCFDLSLSMRHDVTRLDSTLLPSSRLTSAVYPRNYRFLMAARRRRRRGQFACKEDANLAVCRPPAAKVAPSNGGVSRSWSSS